FFIHSAVGQQTVQGGVIHFRGAIVEPLCDISTHAENIDLTCLREGKKQMHRIDLRQASGLPQDIQSIATVRLHYLDAQKVNPVHLLFTFGRHLDYRRIFSPLRRYGCIISMR
ncbi:hypothetical protein L243_22495, partial [Salmonella enterica subsp. enterica serovar Worthington str. BCH-3008]